MARSGQQLPAAFMNATGGKRSAEQRPVCVDAAQRADDRNIPDEILYDVNLFEHPIDHLVESGFPQ
ncbi:hypothetical protein [Paenarthrobacter sp.]|uniref:hypothetical protein n=1 Tax=Paenarthrobacter sp. TaxID=1931993 RepID=UPI002811B995|nr:hypothetical protein [Paenarthrobacter sp.]